jgi:hypothetical protein
MVGRAMTWRASALVCVPKKNVRVAIEEHHGLCSGNLMSSA